MAAQDHTSSRTTPKIFVSTPRSASVEIQRCYRGRLGRQVGKDIVKSIYEKLYDEDSGVYYYWNTITETSQWHKPKVLGPDEDIEIEV
mmetsp:Transcript_31584/g.40603  ORF Transcript_31584/g.40603 Transcript_31584/m.40603 type:complete len:88 (+) Transcript_31584:3506-3769(+)